MKRLNHVSENTFLKLFFTFFSLCFLAAAFFMPDRDQMIPGFLKILGSPTKASANFFSIGGYSATFLLNAGFYGLYVLFYYNVIGAEFNGITFGIIFGMLSTCNAGSHPGNVWPIMTGYALASHLSQLLSHLAGGTFSQPLHAQAMMVGLCFANGLTPISDKYGWRNGLFAAILHYYMVTTVPNLHGGFCLYNGGFTANLVCILLLPILEHHFKTKQQRLDMRNSDAVLFE